MIFPILLLIMLVGTPILHDAPRTFEPLTPSGEYLPPDSNKSATYNSGFAQGYLGFPLKGHHTPIFLAAYKNGTGLYWSNRGETEGYYNEDPTVSEKENPNYMSGWNQGQWIRSPSNFGFDKSFYPRPNQTGDNYLDYYVGDYNGAVAADRDNDNGGDNGTSNHCGSGHTQEYCLGFKTGYSVES